MKATTLKSPNGVIPCPREQEGRFLPIFSRKSDRTLAITIYPIISGKGATVSGMDFSNQDPIGQMRAVNMMWK